MHLLFTIFQTEHLVLSRPFNPQDNQDKVDSQARKTETTLPVNAKVEGVCVTCHSTLLWYSHVSHTVGPGHSSIIWLRLASPPCLFNAAGCDLVLKSPFLRGILELDTLFCCCFF